MKKIQLIILFIVTITIGESCSKDGGAGAGAATSPSGSGTGGSMARFTIVGNYLYTVDKTDLKVFSIIDPANPILKNKVPVGFEIETIYPFKDKLFIGSTSVVHIFSITNPENPVKLSTAISPTVLRRCDPVIARDTVAYATIRTNSSCGGGVQSILAVYDIKDIQNPIQKTFRPLQEPYGLGFADSALYVATQSGLNVYNIATEYNPIFISTIRNQDWFYDVIPYGNTLIAWTKDGVILFDITIRKNPVFITKII
jgi:hypothetical protein